MIIFLAGSTTKDIEQRLTLHYPARLRTYVDVRKPNSFPRNSILFLDSGAFTFQRTGETVPLERYAEFVIRYGADIAASMDVIGDPAQTDKNYRRLKELGAPVVPVFHSNWSDKMIEAYVEEHEFILAGGMVPLARQPEKLSRYLNTVFRAARKYWPRRIHAFGITGDAILEKYPFYSADSTSWLGYSRFGQSLLGKTRLNTFIAKTQPGHGKLWQEVEYTKSRARFLTDLWARRGIVWTDTLSTKAYQFYGGLNVSEAR